MSTTRPAPEYALSFSSDAVHLMERPDPVAPPGPAPAARWRERASAPFDAPDFRSEMARLRTLVANGPDARVALIIPDDQILYTSLPMGGGDVAAGLGRALDGLTPYPVAELAWDWRADGGSDVRVAAVARQTLREAEDFARRHGFDTDGFVADPAEGLFPVAPRFADAEPAVAAGAVDLPGDMPQDDAAPAAQADAAGPTPVPQAAAVVPADADDDSAEAPAPAGTADDDGDAVASAAPDAAAEPKPAGDAPMPPSNADGDQAAAPTLVAATHGAADGAAGDGAAADADAAADAAVSAPGIDGVGSRVTAFLPDDLPSAVPVAPQAALAEIPPSDLIGTSDAPLRTRPPQPLPDRARAVLDRAAAARSSRPEGSGAAPDRHPGARGGPGGLLVMLGALLLGLVLIWSFATPDPRAAVPAPVAAIQQPAVPAAAAPRAAVPAPAPVSTPTPAATAIPATTPAAAPETVPAANRQTAVPAAPAVPVVAPETAAVPANAGASEPAGAAALPAPATAAPDAAVPAGAQPRSSTAAVPASQPLATTQPLGAQPAPSAPVVTRAAPARPASVARRPQPAAAPKPSDADQLPAVVPGRRALTRSDRPTERPSRATTVRAAETRTSETRVQTTQSAPAKAPANAAPRPADTTGSAAPVRSSRPAQAPRAAPVRADSAASADGTATRPSSSRPVRRPEEGSADESVTAAQMTPAERATADLWLAELYRLHPAVEPLDAAQPVRFAEARPSRRPSGETGGQSAVDAAVQEAVTSELPRKKKKPAAETASEAKADSDRPAARAKTADSKAEPKTGASKSASADDGRPASRPGRKAKTASPAAVESAIAEAVGKSTATPGAVALATPKSLIPARKPQRNEADAEAEAVAAAAAARPRPAAEPQPETRTAARSPAAAVVPPVAEDATAAQRLKDEQLQAQAEERARASAATDARAEMQARAAAEARARAQAAAEERAAIASRGEYRPPENDDEPEVAVTAAKGTSKGQVASAATVGGMNLGKTQVIGVIGAGRASRGLIRLRNGKIVTVRLGDRIDGGAINSIGNGRISYVKGGRQFNLPILNGR